MSCWGMGITQSDEYCEIYERFMEEYDEGKPVKDITADILEEYLSEFDAEDGILHDVYFALAKGQWMCGGVQPEILEKVRTIIVSGANLEFLRELEADERDLKQRKRNLDKFLAGLQVPRSAVRKRKKPESAYVPPKKHPPLPQVRLGDVVVYPDKEGWRALLVIQIQKDRDLGKSASCFVWNERFDQIPTTDILWRTPGLIFGRIGGEAFPKDIQVVDNIYTGSMWLMGRVYSSWERYITQPAESHQLYRPLPQNLCVPLNIAHDHAKEWWYRTTGQRL